MAVMVVVVVVVFAVLVSGTFAVADTAQGGAFAHPQATSPKNNGLRIDTCMTQFLFLNLNNLGHL